MKQLARMSLAVTAIVASGWASVSAITACSSSTNNSGSSSSGGSSGGSSGAAGSSSSGAGSSSSGAGSSSGGTCTLNAAFGNVNTGTCPECAMCVSPYCCSSINACYMDPGCAALMACEFGCYGGTLPGDAAAPDGGDCPTLCTMDVDAGAISRQLYMAETTCWENGGPGSTACASPCMCNSTPEGGAPEGGMDATTPMDSGSGPMDAGGG